MPSKSYRRWTSIRANALDEIEQAHAAMGGTGRGRRYTTQQLNQAYVLLLAAQFQGFCRDLHSECVESFVTAITSSAALRSVLRREFTWNRQLDRGNAQPSSIGADFQRLGIPFWIAIDGYDPRNINRRAVLELLNSWRNAIAHHDFDPVKLGGTSSLRLVQVRRWRIACRRLARSFDEVMRRYLHSHMGTPPW